MLLCTNVFLFDIHWKYCEKFYEPNDPLLNTVIYYNITKVFKNRLQRIKRSLQINACQVSIKKLAHIIKIYN